VAGGLLERRRIDARSRAAAPGRRQRRGRVRVGDLRGRAEDTLARFERTASANPRNAYLGNLLGEAPEFPHYRIDRETLTWAGAAAKHGSRGKSAENDAVSGP